MRKIVVLACAATLALCPAAAFADEVPPSPDAVQEAAAAPGETAATVAITADMEPDAIIDALLQDASDTSAYLQSALSEALGALGTTYDDYLANSQVIADWYSLVNEQMYGLFDRVYVATPIYFNSVVTHVDLENSKALDRAKDAFHDEIYEDFYKIFREGVYEDCFDDLRDVVYDGILKDRPDDVGYDDYSKTRSQFFQSWSWERSYVYRVSSWSRDLAYEDRGRISDIFWSGNYDINYALPPRSIKYTSTPGSASSRPSEPAPDASAAPEIGDVAPEPEPEPVAEPVDDTVANDAVNPDFKSAMDGYEQFFDGYVAFMQTYAGTSDPTQLTAMLSDYAAWLEQYADVMQKIQAIDFASLSMADAAYYTEVMARITDKLSSVGQ